MNKILNKKYLDEEYRNIYVALTRAASILVVSQVINLNQSSSIIKWMLNSGAEFLELDETNVDELMEVESIKKDLEDELNLSFTSIEDYDMCPHKYNLIYNYDFVNPQNVYMRIGSIIHSILNKINTLAINGDEDLDDEVERIIDESKESNSDLLENNIFINLLDQLDEYTAESEEWEILESEYPFTIKKPNYTLKGQIDLIRKIENGISLLDFKTTSADSMDIDNNRYEDQLHFYHMAIKGNDKYKHHEEIMLELFSVSDMDESFEVPFSQEHIYELEGKLNRIHNEISNKQYWKCDDDSECAKCLLRGLCAKN